MSEIKEGSGFPEISGEEIKRVIKVSDAADPYFPEDLGDKLDEYKERLKDPAQESYIDEYNCRIFIGERLLEKKEIDYAELAEEYEKEQGDKFNPELFSKAYNIIEGYYEGRELRQATPFELEDRLERTNRDIAIAKGELERASERGREDEVNYWQEDLRKLKDKKAALERKQEDRRHKKEEAAVTEYLKGELIKGLVLLAERNPKQAEDYFREKIELLETEPKTEEEKVIRDGAKGIIERAQAVEVLKEIIEKI